MLLLGMWATCSRCLVLVALLCGGTHACSPLPGWQPSTPHEQWAAAVHVVHGRAVEVSQYLEDMTQNVVIEDLTFSKGAVACSRITVAGFMSSAACGADPPPVGTNGTSFLCSINETDTEGECTAELNVVGNIHIGFIYGQEVSESSICRPAQPRGHSLPLIV
eukprot:2460183-Amphidinium_carterae.1